jgi:hypothetical protein
MRQHPSEKHANLRFCQDGIWTTRHPVAPPFSKAWINSHTQIAPHSWELIKMAFTVGGIWFWMIVSGTIARAILNGVKLRVSATFIEKVQFHISFKIGLKKRLRVQSRTVRTIFGCCCGMRRNCHSLFSWNKFYYISRPSSLLVKAKMNQF